MQESARCRSFPAHEGTFLQLNTAVVPWRQRQTTISVTSSPRPINFLRPVRVDMPYKPLRTQPQASIRQPDYAQVAPLLLLGQLSALAQVFSGAHSDDCFWTWILLLSRTNTLLWRQATTSDSSTFFPRATMRYLLMQLGAGYLRLVQMNKSRTRHYRMSGVPKSTPRPYSVRPQPTSTSARISTMPFSASGIRQRQRRCGSTLSASISRISLNETIKSRR